MAAIKRRRGSAASLVRGLADGLAFCSGGNFSTGSAIALLIFSEFFGRILDRVAHVFLDRFQLSEQAVGLSRADAFERGRRQLGTKPAQLGEQWARGLAQMEAVDAAVGFVATPLDPAIVTEPVDQPRQGDWLH